MARLWYCVQAQHGHSTGVKEIIESRGFTVFQPMGLVVNKLRTKYQLKPLLGDYLFVLFDKGVDNWRAIYQMRYVKDILGLTKGVPSAIPNRSIRILRALSANYDDIQPGNLVKVIKGNKHRNHLGVVDYADGEQVALRLLDGKNTMFSFDRENVALTKWTRA